MSVVVRVDVRSSQSEAENLKIEQEAKGGKVTMEQSEKAVWNWQADSTPTPDVVARNAKHEVWIVITRMG